MITTEQRERLVGQVMLGVSVETACECLGISELDLAMRCHWDDVLRQRLGGAVEFDRELQRQLLGDVPDE
jgi:hypothetical protein